MPVVPQRLTNAAPGWIGNEYASINPFNADRTRILLIRGGTFWLYDVASKSGHDIPILASEEPRWDVHAPDWLYYIPQRTRNALVAHNVATGAERVVHVFSEYSSINGKGESDISEDGNHFVFYGTPLTGLPEVFVFELTTVSKSWTFQQATPIDGLKISPDNRIILSGPLGIFVLDPADRSTRKLCNADGHAAVGRDVDGSEILVWTNSDDPTPIACSNGIVKVRLADGRQTCLLSLDWSLAVDISLHAGVCLVSTYAPTASGAPYTDQILKVALDGSPAEILCDHGSRPLNSYNWQPKAALSRDGSRFVFSSNMGAIPPGAGKDYIDTYGAAIAPVPPDPTWKPFIDRDQNGNLRMSA